MAYGRPTGNAGKGRPKGSTNKETKTIKDAFLKVFEDRGGWKGLREWSDENPDEFYKTLGKMVPKELEVSGPDGGPINAKVEIVFANDKHKS